ncbi:MAG: hypothetical protein ACE5D1_06025, partial [Fidelibacterota bacterium]
LPTAQADGRDLKIRCSQGTFFHDVSVCCHCEPAVSLPPPFAKNYARRRGIQRTTDANFNP